MKKKYIVKSHQDFNAIIKTGKKVNGKYFVIYYKENNINHSRFGISVGKKLGNAVFRNNHKRKIRMIIDQNDNIKDKKSDFIIILKKNGSNLKYAELQKDFNELVKKIKEK